MPVLLPTQLYAQWQGPYQIMKRKGQVNYVVDMHDRRNRHRLFHVKQFVSPPACMYVSEVQDEKVDDEVPVWKEDPTEQARPTIGEQLSSRQKEEIAQLLEELFSRGAWEDKPDGARCGHPIRLPPYRLPHAYREAVHEELKEMLADGRLRLHGVLLLCPSRRKMGL